MKFRILDMVDEPWYNEYPRCTIGLSVLALLAFLVIVLIYVKNKNKKIKK